MHDLEGIAAGRITVAFRRWRRPTVTAHGTLQTALGLLEIGAVTPIRLEDITEQDARDAGSACLADLLDTLAQHEGALVRVALGGLRPDPRIVLRETVAVGAERVALLQKLDRMDARCKTGPWTRRTLAAIGAHPGLRAGDLCERVGQPKDDFKRNVRKLKNLGLTESLEVGYRLSPRGRGLQ